MFLQNSEYAGMQKSWTSDQARRNIRCAAFGRCDSCIQQACDGVSFELPAHTVELFFLALKSSSRSSVKKTSSTKSVTVMKPGHNDFGYVSDCESCTLLGFSCTYSLVDCHQRNAVAFC